MDYNSKRTKIVATIGPASNTMEMLLQLAASGVNVFRLNFSHGTHEDHQKVIDMVREINEKFDYNIALLQDLQGPKIRIGQVENNGVEIVAGDKLVITIDEVLGTSELVSTSYTSFPKDVKVGESILVDDGRLRLEVTKTTIKEVHTTVIVGGLLKSRKGMNLPDTQISEGTLTSKDLKDLEFGLANDVDWVAISFVRSASDLEYLKGLIEDAGKAAKVIAKIERPEALDRIDKIIDATDAIMVARGDLGVETSFSNVPIVQRSIIKKCKAKAKSVIVATQMLESMVKSPIPTRAEVNDIASAVMDGVDGVMLSEESAAGQYPIEAVKAMADVCRSVEVSEEFPYDEHFNVSVDDEFFFSRHIIQNAAQISKDTAAKAIIVISNGGFSVSHISRHRPSAKIFVYTPSRQMVNTFNMMWGTQSFFLPKLPETSVAFLEYAEADMIKRGFLEEGDTYVHVGSIPPKKLGSRMALIGRVGERDRHED